MRGIVEEVRAAQGVFANQRRRMSLRRKSGWLHWCWSKATQSANTYKVGEDTPLPSKFDVARYLLAKGSLFVHLDPRHERVMVPPKYRSEPQLVLQIGFHMPVPIPDLRVDANGVSGTLSFSRSPFTCHVGWAAVFALAGEDGRGMVWPDSMPKEISEEIEREAGREPPVQERPSLRALPSIQDTSGARTKSTPPKSGSRPPYLKVVK